MLERSPRRPSPLPAEVTELIRSLDPEQVRDLVNQLLDVAAARACADERAQRPSRRRPRQAQPSTLVARIDLIHAKPATWRRVELPSTLMLDELHDLLQLLFGWTDTHLHRFALGASVWDRDAELFLCPYDVEEGEDEGAPASQVRLDEVLADAGDTLRYVYDYGDEWTLKIKVERVVPGAPQRVKVVAGRHGAPPDDYGGIWAWNDAPGEAPFDLTELDDLVAAWADAPPLRRPRRRN